MCLGELMMLVPQAAAGWREGYSKGLEMPSWQAGGNQAPVKHLGQFPSGISLLCKNLILHLNFHRREMFRVCFSLALPFTLFGWCMVGFQCAFKWGCVSALCSDAFVSIWEGREPGIYFHSSVLIVVLHSVTPPWLSEGPQMWAWAAAAPAGRHIHSCLSVPLAQWIALSEFMPMEYSTCSILDMPGPWCKQRTSSQTHTSLLEVRSDLVDFGSCRSTV